MSQLTYWVSVKTKDKRIIRLSQKRRCAPVTRRLRTTHSSQDEATQLMGCNCVFEVYPPHARPDAGGQGGIGTVQSH